MLHLRTPQYKVWCEAEVAVPTTLVVPVVRFSSDVPPPSAPGRARELKETWCASFHPQADPRRDIQEPLQWACPPGNPQQPQFLS